MSFVYSDFNDQSIARMTTPIGNGWKAGMTGKPERLESQNDRKAGKIRLILAPIYW
jgi:hypothetical protein